MFSQSLKEKRIAAGYTQTAVAKELGISERAYQHYESGSREPNIGTLIRLADIFNVSLDNLVGRTFPKETGDE